MATPKLNRFTEWELTLAEQVLGFSFSSIQIYCIQNLIAAAALEKSSLTFDPNNPLVFTQREAELQGQIGILEYLLSQHSVLSQLQQNQFLNGE